MRIEILDEVDSTNDYIVRYLPYGEDVAVSAVRQTGGRGTKGRSFLSEEGGVYLTLLRFYRGVPAENAFPVMANAATAVARTVEEYGLSAEIKWPNDVLVSGRKIAGILVRNGIEGGLLRHSIVGIGLNVNNDVSCLNGIAISLSEALKTKLSVDGVRNTLLRNLNGNYGLEEYLKRVRFLGREVVVTEGENTFSALAERIEPDGRLVVSCGGAQRALSAAEISLKL